MHRSGNRDAGGQPPVAGGRHLSCPFCASYDVDRLYLASLGYDSCDCATCGGRWDEAEGSGEYRGQAQESSVIIPRVR
ncbi:MAG: hypothetical protein NVS3B12_19710 [Acidimicrobiales bacterium]